MDQPTTEMAESSEQMTGATCQSIDWYAEGESRTVQVGDVVITVRFVGRNGRRGRIVIEAPAGTVFIAKALTTDKFSACGD